jgi:type II secretory pathway pseudopilin PulG
LEVLIAFVILAFSLGAITSQFSGSLRSVRQGEEYAEAVAVARTQLAQLDLEGMESAGPEAGETEEGYRWRRELSPLAEESLSASEDTLEPVVVTVTVSWGTLRERSIELSTVRLAPR